MEAVKNAIEELEKQKQAKLLEIEAIDKVLTELSNAILVISPSELPRTREYADLGIVEATVRWLKEVGEPRNTREIADALLSRGLTTKSGNFIATLYATLANSKKLVRNEGLWSLPEKQS